MSYRSWYLKIKKIYLCTLTFIDRQAEVVTLMCDSLENENLFSGPLLQSLFDLMIKTRDFEKAEVLAEELVKTQPSEFESWYSLAKVKVETGKLKEVCVNEKKFQLFISFCPGCLFAEFVPDV